MDVSPPDQTPRARGETRVRTAWTALASILAVLATAVGLWHQLLPAAPQRKAAITGFVAGERMTLGDYLRASQYSHSQDDDHTNAALLKPADLSTFGKVFLYQYDIIGSRQYRLQSVMLDASSNTIGTKFILVLAGQKKELAGWDSLWLPAVPGAAKVELLLSPQDPPPSIISVCGANIAADVKGCE
jgi:hypothetical protein